MSPSKGLPMLPTTSGFNEAPLGTPFSQTSRGELEAGPEIHGREEASRLQSCTLSTVPSEIRA